MTFHTSNTINITLLYIPSLPRAGQSLTTLEHRLTIPTPMCLFATNVNMTGHCNIHLLA